MARVCDKCGNEAPENPGIEGGWEHKGEPWVTFRIEFKTINDDNDKQMDLCEKCLLAMLKFWMKKENFTWSHRRKP